MINSINAVAMPSIWEACGLLAMEALVTGTPLIASDCIGLRLVIKGTPTFIAEGGNANSLAKAMESCIEDNKKDQFESYIPKAKARYDVRRTSEQLFNLYHKMVGKPTEK